VDIYPPAQLLSTREFVVQSEVVAPPMHASLPTK